MAPLAVVYLANRTFSRPLSSSSVIGTAYHHVTEASFVPSSVHFANYSNPPPHAIVAHLKEKSWPHNESPRSFSVYGGTCSSRSAWYQGPTQWCHGKISSPITYSVPTDFLIDRNSITRIPMWESWSQVCVLQEQDLVILSLSKKQILILTFCALKFVVQECDDFSFFNLYDLVVGVDTTWGQLWRRAFNSFVYLTKKSQWNNKYILVLKIIGKATQFGWSYMLGKHKHDKNNVNPETNNVKHT